MAGGIAELARNGMAKDFRNFDPASARILLVQAGLRVLPQFDERLSAFARSSLEALGVEVHTDSRVELIDGDGVVVNGERIEAGTVLWAAGVVASPASRGSEPRRILLAASRSPRISRFRGTPISLRSAIPRFPVAWDDQTVPGLRPPRSRAALTLPRFCEPGCAAGNRRHRSAITTKQPGHDRPQERGCGFWTG